MTNRTSTRAAAKTSRTRFPWKPVAIAGAIILALGLGAVIGSGWPGSDDAGPGPDAAPTDSDAGDGAQTDGGAESTGSSEQADADTGENPYAQLVRAEEGDPFAIGAVDAPVVIIEYADFTCRYCGVFAEETLPALIDEYVEAGQVRIEWRDAPILSEYSVQAAIAGRAAAEQDLFWEFYEVIFAHTYEGGEYERSDLLGLAEQVDGLDVAAFETALDDSALGQAVMDEGYESQQLGIQSTPTFVVGSQALQGAQPVEVFRQLIDEQLAAL